MARALYEAFLGNPFSGRAVTYALVLQI